MRKQVAQRTIKPCFQHSVFPDNQDSSEKIAIEGIVQAIIPRLQIDLTISEPVPFQNHAGLRGSTQTGRP
jgi:hypothetical protein